MWILGTLSVLTITLSITWSMTIETTTSRYFEESYNLERLDSRTNNFSIIKNDFLVNNSLFNSNYELKVSGNNRPISLLVQNVTYTGNHSELNKENEYQFSGRKLKSNTKKNDVGNKLDFSQNLPKIKIKATTKTPKKSTKGSKLKLSTIAPVTTKKTNVRLSTKKITKIKLTAPTNVKNKLKLTTTNHNSKWNNTITIPADLKQNWYEADVPYPSPRPEITSSSPPFAISDLGYASEVISSSTPEYINEGLENINPDIFLNSASEPLQGVPPVLPVASETELLNPEISDPSSYSGSNPISNFNLDMLPSSGGLTKDSIDSANPCPTVHIASSVLSPLGRQGCSDLNLVLNTHYHQNQNTRNPDVSTYDGAATGEEVLADPVAEAVEADPGVASDAVGPASSYTGGTGGSGGSGGSGGDGSGSGDGGFKLPSLKPMFEALGYLARGLWWLIKKLMNPWLYIVPITFFFKLGFFKIIALFPWWIPFLILYLSVRTDEPDTRPVHIKHIHKPLVVKHRDGWFWDQKSKTWKDVSQQYNHGSNYRRVDLESSELPGIDDEQIEKFGERYLEPDKKQKRKRKR